MMNYELIMLRNANRLKKSAQMLTEEMKQIALKSYATTNWRNGTMGQVKAIAMISQQIDEYLTFYNSVKKALLITPVAQRALLVCVYVKRVDPMVIAQKYTVSRATVYRKLFYARKAFRLALTQLGCDEEWFNANFGGYDWNDK